MTTNARGTVMMNRLLLALVLTPFILVCSSAQTRLLDNIQVYDATTNKSVKLSKPSGITETQELVFPSTAGTVGQVLTITGKSGSTLTLGWSTEAVSTATFSDRLTSDQDATSPAGLVVTVAANKKYQFSGVLIGHRNNVAGGSTASDNVKVSVTGPPGSSRVSISVRCFDCPGGTVGIPTYAGASSNTVATGALDPAGPSPGNPEYYTACAYAVEGVVETGANTGTITVKMEQSTGDYRVVIKQNSYIVVTGLD